MGVGVSNWSLAQTVSKLGQLGVVSGTALDSLFVRRLADGDFGGHMRRGLDAFPFPDMARRIWAEYFTPGGKAEVAPYPTLPMHQLNSPRKLIELCMVGINFLEKVQMPHLASIYGAMLAGVGFVLMGAGIPLHIPGVLDAFAAHHAGEYKLQVTGALPGQDTQMHFDPTDYIEGPLPILHRPRFLAIVSSNTLATTMLRRANGRVDGFVIESPTAGGHNAPPRGKLQLNAAGEPIYGERDQVDIAGFRAMGVPFWLAGGYGSPEKLREALEMGAAGVQVGTAFAFSEESGMRADLKKSLIGKALNGTGEVFTDPVASPTGFPFKVAQLEGTSSSFPIYQERKRVCDLGYLREPYAAGEGKVAYRCSAEPVENYVMKGGKAEDTVGRKCLCNALMANVGHQQTRKDGSIEPPLITVGDDLNTIVQYLKPGHDSYSAVDVVETMLSMSMDMEEPAERELAATA
jgi:nitronate monooxygenase